jgi:glycosyltransferase involved in cell wall biosynthesis
MEGDAEPWTLKIAGTGEGDYSKVLKSKVEKLGLQARVEFLGEVFGEAKENLFAESDVLVVPSYVENFGMVIAEALAHEVPVIAARGTPWKGLQTTDCGLWVENDAESLATAIRRMRRLPLKEMGKRGRCWMQREFSWEAVSRQMLAVFQDCCCGLSARAH